MLIHAGIENDTQFEGLPSGLNGVLGNTDRSTIGGRLGIKRRGVCLEGEGSLKRIRDDAVALLLLDREYPYFSARAARRSSSRASASSASASRCASAKNFGLLGPKHLNRIDHGARYTPLPDLPQPCSEMLLAETAKRRTRTLFRPARLRCLFCNFFAFTGT